MNLVGHMYSLKACGQSHRFMISSHDYVHVKASTLDNNLLAREPKLFISFPPLHSDLTSTTSLGYAFTVHASIILQSAFNTTPGPAADIPETSR